MNSFVEIELINRKCKYCSKKIAEKENLNFHLSCKKEIDQYHSLYDIKNPWMELWVNLLIKNLKFEFFKLIFQAKYSIDDLFVELKNFVSYNVGMGFIFQSLCFVRFNNPTWICLKENTAIDANNYNEWNKQDFSQMVNNFLYNTPEIIRQYTANPLLQLYFPLN